MALRQSTEKHVYSVSFYSESSSIDILFLKASESTPLIAQPFKWAVIMNYFTRSQKSLKAVHVM